MLQNQFPGGYISPISLEVEKIIVPLNSANFLRRTGRDGLNKFLEPEIFREFGVSIWGSCYLVDCDPPKAYFRSVHCLSLPSVCSITFSYSCARDTGKPPFSALTSSTYKLPELRSILGITKTKSFSFGLEPPMHRSESNQTDKCDTSSLPNVMHIGRHSGERRPSITLQRRSEKFEVEHCNVETVLIKFNQVCFLVKIVCIFCVYVYALCLLVC